MHLSLPKNLLINEYEPIAFSKQIASSNLELAKKLKSNVTKMVNKTYWLREAPFLELFKFLEPEFDLVSGGRIHVPELSVDNHGKFEVDKDGKFVRSIYNKPTRTPSVGGLFRKGDRGYQIISNTGGTFNGFNGFTSITRDTN